MEWYEWHTVSERLQARLYALTKGKPFRLRLDTGFPTGYCDFKNKLVVVNPIAFKEVIANEISEKSKQDEANYLMSRALLGHEALHTLYTDPDTFKGSNIDPDLKNITNILEDARIENIGAQESHVSKSLFKLLSSTANKLSPKFEDPDFTNPQSGVHVLLMWRFGFAVPELGKEAQAIWIQVRNVAEGALYAPSTEQVVIAAQKIVDILGLRKNRQEQPNDQLRDGLQNVLNKLESIMCSGGSGLPRLNPLEKCGYSQDQKIEKQSEDQQDSQNSPDPGQNSQDGSDSENSESQNEQLESEQISQDRGDSTENTSDSSEDVKPKAGQSENTYTSEFTRVYENLGDRDQDASDSNLSDLVDEIGSAVQESLSASVPQGDSYRMLRSAAKSRRGESQPDILGVPYIDLYTQAVPIAQTLEKELRNDDPHAVTGASSQPGRFKSRYHIRNNEKPFSQQKFHGVRTPKMALTLVLDRSSSMRSMMDDLKLMTMAIYIACEELKIPLDIWVLEGQIHLKKFDEWSPAVMARIAGIEALTNTRMMPTLNDATSELIKRPESLKQIVMIHDGSPADTYPVTEWRKQLREIGLFCMYIVSGKDHGGPLVTKSWSMDELVGPQNYTIAFVQEIAKLWCSYMKNRRRSHSMVI